MIETCTTCEVIHTDAEWQQLGGTCGRCAQHTGNNTQGHYWKFCKVTKTMRDFHFCCPDNCELEVITT